MPEALRPMSRFVDVRGKHLHYLHAGAGKPLLLIHGIVGSSLNWHLNIGALAGVAEVYAIDLLNAGSSERVPGLDARLDATADRVVDTMDALGLTQSDIVGHSHGGAVTLMLAARHPERVRSLILIAPANPYSHVGDALLRSYNRPLGRLIARAGPYLPRKIQRYALGRMYGDPSRVTERCLQGYIDSLRVPGTIQHILAIVRDWFPEMAKLEVALPRIAKIPTLLVWGDRDRAVDPASADRLLEVLPNSELRKIHDAGHIPFEEMPEQTNRVMLDWLDRDPASGTGRADAAARAGG